MPKTFTAQGIKGIEVISLGVDDLGIINALNITVSVNYGDMVRPENFNIWPDLNLDDQKIVETLIIKIESIIDGKLGII